jgi:hypothetical protein
MKRFLIFEGQCYYPLGGMDDFVIDFDNIETVHDYMVKNGFSVNEKEKHPLDNEWLSVYDTEKREELYLRFK